MDSAARDAAVVAHLQATYEWKTTIATQCVLRDDLVRSVREAVGPGFSIFDVTRYVRRAFPGYPENKSAIRVTRMSNGLNLLYVNNICEKSAAVGNVYEGLLPGAEIEAIPKPVCTIGPHRETKDASEKLFVGRNWQNDAPGISAADRSVIPHPHQVAAVPIYDKSKPIANVSAFKVVTKPATKAIADETPVYNFNFAYPPDVYQIIGVDTWVNGHGDLWEDEMNDNFVWYTGMELEEAGQSDPTNVELIDLTDD